MIDFNFCVAGPPVGAARPRVVRRPGGGTMAFTPDKTVRYEHSVGLAAREAMGWAGEASRISGPVEVSILAVFVRPKRLQRRADPSGLVWHLAKPDADNVAKAVLDGLRHVLDDDAQVVRVLAQKVYAPKASPSFAQTQIRVRAITTDGPL